MTDKPERVSEALRRIEDNLRKSKGESASSEEPVKKDEGDSEDDAEPATPRSPFQEPDPDAPNVLDRPMGPVHRKRSLGGDDDA
jgi:hypothetical protein